jgi:predicted SnoaL-like aldol condensation-catalyzing enzyme
MPEEDNAALVAFFLDELWNQRNVDIIDQLLADTYVDHTPPANAVDQEVQGPETLKRFFEALHLDFSSIHVSIEDQIAKGDKVMTRVTWECTPKSDDPSTALPVTVMGVGVDRIDHGKIVENWNTLDVLYRLHNLLGGPVGTMPPPVSPKPPPVSPKPPLPPCGPHHKCSPGFICQKGICQRV